jgi:polar amino acid transport system permease protein
VSAHGRRRPGLLGRISPSNFIFLLVLPAVVYLFLTAENYQRAFIFIWPGVWMTISVAVGAYAASAVLGLGLAGLLALSLGKRTLWYFAGVAGVLALLSAFYFTRPTTEYVLVGELSGRVAIIQGTPARVTGAVRFGRYVGGEPTDIRSAATPQAALDLLQAGTVTGAFLPADLAPADAPVLYRATFLPDAQWIPGVVLAVFALLVLLLLLGSWQSGLHPLAVFAELYVDLVRGIPMLVVILFVGFVLTRAISDATGIRIGQYARGVAALSIGYSAYMAEIFRAGIEAIPKGQFEAARSLGLSGWQTARYVVLPQAIKIVIPPLGNEFIAMLKDTALLSVISVRELTQRTREFQSNTFILFPTFNTVAIIYIVLTLAASSLVKWGERRTDTGGRR